METTEVIRQFNDAFQKHDASLLVGLIAEDCVLENTVPAPDGARYVGREAEAFWSSLASSPQIKFDLEEVFVAGDRSIIRWRLHPGNGSSVRGVNLMRVRNGLIVEALGYVKG